MADQEKDLKGLRDKIDSIDGKILELISARAAVAQEVARVKEAAGATDAFFYRPEREAQVLRRIMTRNDGPLDDEEMARLFREIMSACLALEEPVRVAYLGPEGTFTQQAALKHFGHSAVSVPMAAIDEVFREVESGAVNYGVVPSRELIGRGGQPYPGFLYSFINAHLWRGGVANPSASVGGGKYPRRENHSRLLSCPVAGAVS